MALFRAALLVRRTPLHNIDEVWCAALWEVRARMIDRLGHATGNQRMLQLVTDGMKLDPVNPTFLDGRNSILAADCAGFSGKDELDIWAGFATRGMGASASAVSSSSSSVVEAFDVPNLNLGAVTITADTCEGGDGFADPGETLTLNIPLSNPFCATSANTVTVALNGGAPVNYGTIAAGATTAMGISFSIPNNPALCGTVLPVMVMINSSLGPVTRTYNLQIGRPTGAIPASFSTGNLSVPIPDANTVEIPLNVVGVGSVADVNVRVRLNHTFDGDLVISLVHPDGTTVALANNRGGGGDNFGTGVNDCSGTHTVFDDAAATAIGAGTVPFAGTFRPDALLSGLNGKPVSSIWKLRVADTATLDTSTVGCFQLEIAQQLYACCGVLGTPNVFAAPPATLAAESCVGANGASDPLETVTVNFPLRNLGTGSTTNLVATLLPGGGVNLPSGPQNYGVVVAGGPAVARPFTFAITGTCGGMLTATLQLQDGATNLGTVTFTITLGGTAVANSSFSNPGTITILDTPRVSGIAPSSPYPSTINVAGVVGTVSKVTVDLFNLSHTFPSDIDVLLVGPGGQRLLLMSDLGSGDDAANANLTFDNAAPSLSGQVVSGTFRPTNLGTGDTFLAPAPAGPYPDPQQLTVFNGVNPNGTWSLYVVDDVGTDAGSISGGWRLNLTTSDPVCCTSPCTLSSLPNITVLPSANIVNYPLPTVVSGSCGVPVCVPPSGTAFPLGVTTVNCTAQNGGATSFTVTVACPTLTLAPSLANGVQGTGYNQTVALVADSSYTFAVTTNALPPGLTLNPATGAITSIPTAAGNFTFNITATGVAGCTKSQSYNLLITGTCVTITVNPSILPNGTVGTAYPSTTVSATGGVASYGFTVSQGALPPGLTLSASTGEVAGTPTQPGVFSFRITASGVGGCTGSRNYVVSIGCATLTFNLATLPNPVKGVPYNQTISVNPFSNYTVSLLLGQLPPGLTLSSNPSNSTATISGRTTQTGPYSFTLKAQAGICQGTKTYSFAVGNMPALAL
jgi:subtilisin-like proprotein convertase family protein